MEAIMQSVEKECNLCKKSGKARSVKDPAEAGHQIVVDLTSLEAFVHTPGREGHHFHSHKSAATF